MIAFKGARLSEGTLIFLFSISSEESHFPPAEGLIFLTNVSLINAVGVQHHVVPIPKTRKEHDDRSTNLLEDKYLAELTPGIWSHVSSLIHCCESDLRKIVNHMRGSVPEEKAVPTWKEAEHFQRHFDDNHRESIVHFCRR